MITVSEQEAGNRVEQLTGLTEKLTALITEECQAFEQRRPHEVTKTLEETGRLANLYRHESMRVRNNVGLVQAAPLAKRMRLMQATEAFEAVLARHGRALEAAKTVTEGLVRAVAEEVASTRATGAGYGPTGVNAAALAAKAMTLNKRA